MQLLFNLPLSRREEPTPQHRMRLCLRRAIIKWLFDSDPEHIPVIGVDVPAKGATLHADVAAAWLENRRERLSDGRMATITTPRKTAVVLCATERQDCWPECADPEAVAHEIVDAKRKIHEIEEVIRQQEPELRDSNMLFEEYATWNYGASRNKAYHKLHRHLTQLEASLYKGSRLARLCRMQAADDIYLAIPKGILAPEEILDSWGLLEVDLKTMETRVAKEPEPQRVLPEIQQSLVMNIANAGTRATLKAFGVRLVDRHPAVLVKMPTNHRKQSK